VFLGYRNCSVVERFEVAQWCLDELEKYLWRGEKVIVSTDNGVIYPRR
jgi:predicted transcriptional regulator